jgi:hypothetical protein
LAAGRRNRDQRGGEREYHFFMVSPFPFRGAVAGASAHLCADDAL